MIVVAATCPDCGRVEMPIVGIMLHIRDYADRTRYSFTCPSCEAWVSRPAGPHEVALLRAACCPERRERVPKELLEPHVGPALTVDDLIDLGRELYAAEDLAWRAAVG